jgi:hypothetical protein
MCAKAVANQPITPKDGSSYRVLMRCSVTN